ncbi:tetratricopeptide repeat protein [Luteimonas sp. 50]|uniref:Tetratricopeptide repeat protein n=1 Tax=Cognatiluteimonas sedimenti TaxID=2927791 RepID=A0ABT0A5N7_9GAMM|nr:tetratricopeptide repeat protein [Lysobacter sedimenti]MCJ0826289.1 tetratricopeptide repeat protein [Lysobacter sedimenti]
MKTHSVRTSLIAVALVAVFAATPAIAQEDYGNVGSQSLRAKRDAERAKKAAAQKASEPVAAQYPQATRQEPETIATKEGLKKLTEVQKLYEAQDYANAIAQAGVIAADASSNAYEKAFAHQLAASAAAASGDDAAAAKNFEQALAANGLDNNNHYTVMFNLAVTQYGLGQNEQALQTVDRFLSETKSDKPEAQTLRGGILMALERYDEAGKFYDTLLAQHPDDKSIRMNAVAAYQQSNQPDKAVALLAAAQAKGQLTEASEYRALYVSYINADQDKQALAVIDDGIAKGVIQPGPDLARDYMVLGQKAYYASDLATAIQMYGRAAPMAADGEAALNLAKVYAEAGKPAEAKAAAQQALDKGVKDTAAANKLLGGG